MLKTLRQFLVTPEPGVAQALAALRALFALTFAAQVLLAALLAASLSFFAGEQEASALLSQILLVLSLLQVPLGATLSLLSARSGGKGAALSGTIMAGVVLASTAWFLAFSLLVGSAPLYLVLSLLVVVNAYAVGFFLCGRLAKVAVMNPRVEPKQRRVGEVLRERSPHP